MNRLERLLNLVAALLDAPRPLSRAEIHQRVPGYGEGEAGRRAFERDKDALRGMGIPLVTEPLPGDGREGAEGYRIPPDQYRLPDPGLAADELAALHLAVSTVRLGATGPGGGPGEAAVAIWKLGGAAGQAGATPVAALPGSEHLPLLFSAVGDRRPVAFRYLGEERTVDPHRLQFTGGHWYLNGRDHRRDGTRNFRLDRVESAPRPGPPGSFERPAQAAGPLPVPWRMGEEEEVEAILLVDADQAEWVVARTGPASVREQRDDGSVVVAVGVTNRDAFRTFVLGFLDHAEVLGPPDLRADLVAWLRRLAEPAGGGVGP